MAARMSFAQLFPRSEYDERLARVRTQMEKLGLRAVLVSAPENVFYLTGLEHQGYFAYQMLVVPESGSPVLITRAMERATVRDQVPWVEHVGYSDGTPPLPEPAEPGEDLVMESLDEHGKPVGLRPWEMSAGVAVRGPITDASRVPIDATLGALAELGLSSGRVGLEMKSSFLTHHIAHGLISDTPGLEWVDCSGLVDDCRLVQSRRELELTRAAAAVSDSMLLAAIAAAGPGVHQRDVMAALYDAMFRRGGTYPGFVPLVRSTRTLDHEHGTWQDGKLNTRDILFLEMAGCVRRYHAPMGRLVFIGRAPRRAERIQRVCEDAMLAAAEAIRPGVEAGSVYQAWQAVLDRASLQSYRRHHCGYAVGIGFPPSWSGSGTPRGLRSDSTMKLEAGMVFHLMSWLLRTGKGDFFLSDTIVVTDRGCELLTTVPRGVTVR